MYLCGISHKAIQTIQTANSHHVNIHYTNKTHLDRRERSPYLIKLTIYNFTVVVHSTSEEDLKKELLISLSVIVA